MEMIKALIRKNWKLFLVIFIAMCLIVLPINIALDLKYRYISPYTILGYVTFCFIDSLIIFVIIRLILYIFRKISN